MRGLVPLVLGVFGTFAFSWIGLTVIPNLQIGALNPQSDEEGTDIYPMPQSGMVQRGRRVYAANGCIYCHSQQVRADYASADIERKWGERRSAPRDYIFDRPVMLGKERMGPDLANIGQRAPSAEEKAPATASPAAPAASPATAAASPAPAASASPNSNVEPLPYTEAWHHRHLYSPRSISPDTRDSNMPAYQFLYEKRRISGEPSADALHLTGPDAPPPGWEVVPTYDAKCLVAYLMSQDQSHPLKEVKSGPGVAAPAGSPAASSPVAPAASPAAQPPKK